MKLTILCPTRGGKASYPNQDRAIALARERQAKLLFLYGTNVQFLGLTASPVVVDIESELDEMGEFLLAMAQERAEKAGVASSIVVRRGIFRKVLKEVINEHDVELVVLGSSAGNSGMITPGYIEDLVSEIGRDTGASFIVLDQGEIVGTHHP